jgi:uncharacterized protein YbjT (DUF2867 family)
MRMTIRTVTVFGASARQGQAQVRQLLRQGYRTRAISRQREIFAAPAFRDVTVVNADYNDPASLAKACEGADAVFYQSPQLGTRDQIMQQSLNVADAAKAAGVKRFVLNSTMWAPDRPCGQPLYDSVLEIENAIATRSLPLVVFRPVLFMDNLLTGFAKPSIVAEGLHAYPQKPGLQMDYICLDDVGRFMIEGLKRDDLIGQRIRIGGPQTLTPEDVVRVLSKVLGKPVRHVYVPPKEFGYKFYDVAAGTIPVPREAYAAFFDSFYTFNNESPLQPFRCDMKEVLRRIPLELTTMAEWAPQQDWSLDGEQIGSASG